MWYWILLAVLIYVIVGVFVTMRFFKGRIASAINTGSVGFAFFLAILQILTWVTGPLFPLMACSIAKALNYKPE